jgi:CubicO group peptidase (beta-lactamase class C family)
LQQDGKLKTSDSLRQHYAQAPASWDAVTLRHLLTHSSGIPDVYFGILRTHHQGDIPQILRDLADKPLSFEPGAKFDYSNANYMLLARVVEEASGEPYCLPSAADAPDQLYLELPGHPPSRQRIHAIGQWACSR